MASPTEWKYAKAGYALAGALWVAYLVLYMSAPTGPSVPYHLTELEFNAIKMAVAVPLLGIWLVALYGAARFKQYSHSIAESQDGRSLNIISNGLLILVASVVGQSVIGSIEPYLRSLTWLRVVVFLQNDLPLLLAFLAFLFIYIGSIRVSAIVGGARLKAAEWAILFILYFAFTAAFGWFFYRHLQTLPSRDGVSAFGVGGNLPLLTFALPYLLTWYLGILATIHLATYYRRVKGKVYRQALLGLVRGVRIVLAVSVGLQLLGIDTKIFGTLNLWELLIIVYILLAFYSLGFIAIAIGANKLSLIEEAE